MSAQVILAEASPRRISDGVVQTVRLAGGGALQPYTYGGNDWKAGLQGLPVTIASLEYAGGEFGSGSVPQAMELVWAPATKAGLAAIAAWFWKDAAITVRIGEETIANAPALPAIVQTGKVIEAEVEAGRLKLSLSDPAASLRKPLLTGRYAGTGGTEGPAEWTGLIKPRVWGRVFNLAGQPIDKANNVYCYADPARPLNAITAVRDKGAPAATLNTLAWQGSVAATFTALQAAVAPAGGGVVCPSIACVKWWTQPAGALCADLKGEIGAAYVETTAEIVERLVGVLAGPVFAAGTVAAAAASRPAPVGWVAASEGTTVAAMLDELCGNSSLAWLLNAAGEIVLRPYTWGASAASAVSHAVTRKKTLPPLTVRKLGYQRNETMQGRGELAAIVFAADAFYADGTPVEDLKPAEADADVTAASQVTVELTTDKTIPADYLGAVSSTDLGNVLWAPVVQRGSTAIKVANGTSYALANASGGTFAVDNTNGSTTKGNVTISAMSANVATVELTVTVDGIAQPKLVLRLTKQLAAAPSGGGGGSGATISWSAGEFIGINTTSYTAIVSPVKTITLASGQSLYGTAPLDYLVSGFGAINRTMSFKWQYSVAGANSWNDFATAITGSWATSAFIDGETYDYSDPVPGTVAVTQTKSGLSAGDYDIRMVAVCNATGRTCTPSGVATMEAKV